MGMILDIDDFEFGQFEIALDPEQEADLETYIDDVEAEYLPKLFGKELYDLFVVDWNTAPVGTPTAPRFSMVYDPFVEQNDCVMIQSKGMVEMLKGFVYYLFIRDQITRSTTMGVDSFLGENVEAKTAIQHDTTRRYNDGVDTFKTIQYYMSTFNPKDFTYPEYKGVDLSFATIA
jgi:hypothetical protein